MTTTSNTCEGDDERQPKPTVSVPEWSREAFDRIRLLRHPEGGFGLKMPGGYWVSETTLRRAWTMFWRNAGGLDPSMPHKAENLVGASVWNKRPRGEHIAMGRCFKYFAVHGVLPITLANPEAPYNFKYRLNDDLDQAPTIH